MTRTLLLAAMLLSALPAAAQPPRTLLGPATADALFDDSVLHDITLNVSTQDWQTLKDRYLENTYYPADFRWGSNIVRNVGIKSRGSGSRSGTKPGLKVDFARYTSDQTFLGLKSLVLRNNTQDPSGLRERLSMLIFRRMGLPASREAHARLFINGEYSGLYTIVEPLDKAFLKRTWGDDSGWLYSYEYPTDAPPFYFEDRGDDPALYVPVPFTPETQGSNPRGDLLAAWIQAITRSGDAAWRTVMAQYLDLSRFLRHVAIEAYLGDDDGVLGHDDLRDSSLGQERRVHFRAVRLGLAQHHGRPASAAEPPGEPRACVRRPAASLAGRAGRVREHLARAGPGPPRRGGLARARGRA